MIVIDQQHRGQVRPVLGQPLRDHDLHVQLVRKRTGFTDPENHTTTWHYDANQDLDRVTDADGNLTTNVYDADNELTQVKRADSPQTTLTTDYNPDGTVLDQKDGKGSGHPELSVRQPGPRDHGHGRPEQRHDLRIRRLRPHSTE